jgi:hypothetical protein
MVQGYYTLEEAARILGMATDELSQMAQHREVRAFADRGTWRFRTQDIEELARRRGLGSSPDLQPLGEAQAAPEPKASGSSGDQPVFSLTNPGDSVEIGQEIIADTPSKARKAGGGSKAVPRTPHPKAGSDSDVRLVADGSDLGIKVSSDSDIKIVDDAPARPGKAPASSVRKMAPVRDSDVKVVEDSPDETSVIGIQPPTSSSDSDVRLESGSKVRPAGKEASFLTEEIDLDAELRKAEEMAQAKPKPVGKAPPSGSAPFELSDADLKVPGDSSATAAYKAMESSSDFDLSLDLPDSSSIELSSGELASLGADKEGEKGKKGSSDSGISLKNPADSGISLEKKQDSSDEIDFELTTSPASTPKPAKAPDSADSSSDFELTLEDSARLAPLDEEKGDKDIFETDFEVPALEDDSGSQVVALEEGDSTDLENSDFDLALGEEDAASDEESGSQVVALDDEEEVDEGAATVARKSKRAAADEDEESEEPAAEEEEALVRRPVVAAAPADWGIFTPVVLLISLLFLFVVGLMSFELLHGMWGYRQPYKATSMIIKGVGGLMPWIDSKDLEKD